MSESESLWSNMNAFNWSKSAQLLFDTMSETRSKRECGKEKSLGSPGPLPGSCLATYRDVFLATEYLPGGEEASAEGVKEELKHLFSKVTPSSSNPLSSFSNASKERTTPFPMTQ